MKLYVYGKLLKSTPADPFKDSEGKEVKYHVNVIMTEFADVMSINSKESFAEYEEQEGVFEFNAYGVEGQRPNVVKLSLASFSEGVRVINS